MSSLLLALCIGLGGAVGAVCRSYALDAIDALLVKRKTMHVVPTRFDSVCSWLPVAVLLVNAVACFLAGVFGGLVVQGCAQAFLLAGFCGGFSTLSTVNLDAARLFSGQVNGAGQSALVAGRTHAALYLFATYAVALGAAALGLFLTL